MKKALNFVLMYLVLFFVSVAIGTFMYSIYMDVIGFIAGQKLNFFDPDQIIRALFIVSYSVCFLMCPFINYYRIRHPYGISQLIIFITLCALTWGVIFPGLHFLEQKIYDIRTPSVQISHLSGGYFRKVDNKVYYFTRDFYSNPLTEDDTNTVVIDTSDEGGVTFEKFPDTPEFELYTAAEPYNEVQAKEIFSNKKYGVGIDFRLLLDKGLQCFNSGWTYYLGFITLGLALASLYAFTAFFNWKLINTTFIFMSSILILFVNTYFYSPASEKFQEKIYRIGFLKNLDTIFDNSAIVVLNLIVSLIFILFGVVRVIIRKQKAKAEE